jgi:YfiH family protein
MTCPDIPDTFRWTQEAWGPVLRCRPLERIAAHFFTTRQLALASHGDWNRLGNALGATRVATVAQVHGRDVLVLRSHEGWRHTDSGPQRFNIANRPEADILVSNNPEIVIAVRAADCVPALIGDPRTGAVGAVHAGWRGTAAGAAVAAVESLIGEFDVNPADLVVAIGPSIGPCCYEVGVELVDTFVTSGHARQDVNRWFRTPPGAVKPRLDTWASNRDQLIGVGVRQENIHLSGLCTACNLEFFPSFRAEKKRAGRIAGAIKAAAKQPLHPSPRSQADPHPC